MKRVWMLVVFAALVMASAAAGQQTPCRFQWQRGQVLLYRVEQTTKAAEVIQGTMVETSSKLNDIKRWQVLDVDGAGVGTLQLSLANLRLERTSPSGEVLLFDSAHPDKSNPQMREQLAQYVGKPLAVLRVDGKGKVVEVKECKYGPSSRFESELPFVLTLPEASITVGGAWERAYLITLDPPQGTGEKYKATQKYVCKDLRAEAATITLSTSIQNPPASLLDQVPLLQMQPEGGVIFNTLAGRMERAVLRVVKELKGHQGAGSSYRFESVYAEQYVPEK